ncbi:nicotinamide/nicotinic acid mononucleotide adenylyltransferase 1 isoform X2 [Leptidea sinapis]|uniref:nicotinamide/nicotinic acid mononucleotide adenylyltransferase 1 isoform X2 n=1 Tax=Leptidea sinapis TaxID=189913 RepID=UPI002125A75A|nr:nicotinamide/nicotinic acid mononucleotide adenylyltransferase 1 isoform X2 [Leptidea sinapis]
MSQGKVVLVACGSFSPPTYMHLRLFEIAKDYMHSFGLGTIVGGIVSPVHDAYGKKDLVPAPHRIEMLKLSLKSSSWVKVSEWETQQAGWSRTRVSLQYHQDTINKHKSSHNLNEDPPSWLPDDILNVNNIDEPDNLNQMLNGNVSDDVTVKLLCGADLLESFATPGLWSDEDLETILGRYGIVVVSRVGSDPGRMINESDILYKYRRNVIVISNYITSDVSSTVIRRLVRRGESPKYLTDDAVISYIIQHGLYGARSQINKYTNYINYDVSPNDVIMTSPQDTYKSILISIRDKPSIVDETVTVKKPKSILSHGTVMPIEKMKPKMAYIDKVAPHYVPGKAVKIVSDVKKYEVKEKGCSCPP